MAFRHTGRRFGIARHAPSRAVRAGGAVALLAAAALVWTVPHAARPLLTGVGGLGGADRRLLALAGVAFLATACAAARAWHAALRACDVDASPGTVTARYAIGSLVASFTPAAGGEATRVALIGRLAPDNGGAFAAAGVCALVALVRAAILTLLFSIATFASATGRAAAAALAAAIVGAAVASLLLRRRGAARGRFGHIADALRGAASPAATARIAGWVGVSTAARLTAAGCCAAALGVHHPWAAAFVVVPALELATLVPLTPGNVGVASAAVTLALRQRHVALAPALSAGIAVHLVETIVGVLFGLAGLLAFTRPFAARRVAVVTAIAAAALLGAWLGDVT